ncbi:MAG: sigma-70 family RNA polymerase sigma factor [Cyanobacteria bacterium CRU_2_1]|nr:sigma-70 family RNA polymerase sigma factor [Cyanobacteria bacterium RU_5_0]NJR62451.1 sigma-70 family RNA polymerase sigma factor [Cyanobacteria bacterium CRU_2_1]
MRPRQGITELFSTFLQFDADRFRGWVTDPRLRRSMERSSTQPHPTEPIEDFWVLYWHKAWQAQTHRLARDHLAAYLQEVCYWAAQKVASRFANPQFQLSDCFQVAIARLDKVLQGFNPEHSFSLKSYASLTFGSVLKDTLRQRQVVDICTPWALLNKLSKKRLIESLKYIGLAPDTIDRHVLAWTCFNAFYAPSEVPNRTASTRKLLKPEPETWKTIAKLYNQQRQMQPFPSAPEASPGEIEAWMMACANAVRQYLYPTAISINAPILGQEEGELLDMLQDSEAEVGITVMIAQEESSRAGQINAVLSKAIEHLDPETQKLLQLYYVQELTQQQIAEHLNVKQYNISRQLSRVKRSLQRSLADWSHETLHISPSLDVLEAMSTALEEWLKTHYSQR